jgi:hypothetical protein
MFDDDELVAAIDEHLAHESLVKSRRDAFHIVGKSIPQYAGGIKPQGRRASFGLLVALEIPPDVGTLGPTASFTGEARLEAPAMRVSDLRNEQA